MLEGNVEERMHHGRAALVDNDRELKRVDKVLNEIHGRFYQAYDQSDKRVSFRPASEPTNSIPHDVRVGRTEIKTCKIRKVDLCFRSAHHPAYEKKGLEWLRHMFLRYHTTEPASRRVGSEPVHSQ